MLRVRLHQVDGPIQLLLKSTILLMLLIRVIMDFIFLCLSGQFIPYSLLLQELDIKNLRELEVNACITLVIYQTVSSCMVSRI